MFKVKAEILKKKQTFRKYLWIKIMKYDRQLQE